MTRFIALLRGVNVGGHRPVPMAKLRALCTELGFEQVTTYIQSGNVVFSATGPTRAVEAALEQAMAPHFGFPVDVLVRTVEEWRTYLAGNPFPEPTAAQPNRVMLLLAKRTPEPGAVEALRQRAGSGERVEASGVAIWIHYPLGAGNSKLSPSLLDRLVGSPVTARNVRTVQVLADLYPRAVGANRAGPLPPGSYSTKSMPSL